MALEQDGGIVWKLPHNPISPGSDLDIWDDTALIRAYDRAVTEVKEGLMSESSDNKQSNTGKRKKKMKLKHSNKKSWKAGSKCLSLFSEDGIFYEATILSLDLEARTALVNYDFFNNEEVVKIDDLLPVQSKEDMEPVDSVGVEHQKGRDTFAGRWQISDICFAPDDHGNYQKAVINSFPNETTCRVTFVKNKRRKEVNIASLKSEPNNKAGNHASHTHNCPPAFDFPTGIPHTFPGFPPMPSFMNGYCSACDGWSRLFPPRCPARIPPFPPPPVVPNDVISGDEEALANMLMSWYMSGYHTGYYQGLKQTGGGSNQSDKHGGGNRSRKSTLTNDESSV